MVRNSWVSLVLFLGALSPSPQADASDCEISIEPELVQGVLQINGWNAWPPMRTDRDRILTRLHHLYGWLPDRVLEIAAVALGTEAQELRDRIKEVNSAGYLKQNFLTSPPEISRIVICRGCLRLGIDEKIVEFAETPVDSADLHVSSSSCLRRCDNETFMINGAHLVNGDIGKDHLSLETLSRLPPSEAHQRLRNWHEHYRSEVRRRMQETQP